MVEASNTTPQFISQPGLCAICPDHPRLLRNGSCTFCGTQAAPVYSPPAAPEPAAALFPRGGLGPAPVFPAWMRKPISSPAPGAAPQISETTLTRTGPLEQDAVDVASPEQEHAVESTAHRRREPAAVRAAPRPSAKTQARKRQADNPPAHMHAKQAKIDSNSSVQITKEPLNVDALRDFASRRASDTTHLSGCAATLRECIYFFLQCVDQVHAEGLATIPVVWREATDLEGLPGRRFSGAARLLRDGEGPESAAVQKMQRLVTRGVPDAFVGKSLFAMPKLLRYLARTGLPAADIDQQSSHYWVQWARHKGDAPALERYLTERAQILEDVASKISPSPGWPCDWTATGVAKELFIRLGYGGSVATWASQYSVRHSRLPPFVDDFAREQARLRKLDARRHPDLMALAKTAGHDRPDVCVQSMLNMRGERANLDAMEAALDQEDDVRVGSYEHDGLFVWRLPSNAHEGWERALLELVPSRIRVALKAIPSKATLLEKLRLASPEADWDAIDEDWQSQMDHILAARPGAQLGKEDRLYAQIVALEGSCYDDYRLPVKALFKHAGGGQYWHFDRKSRRWESNTEVGRNELLHVISCVLVRRLSDYLWEFDKDGREVLTREPAGRGTILNNASLLRNVETMLRAPLVDKGFELDGEDTRRYLQFSNGVFDRNSMTFVTNTPEIRVTNTTGWAWEGSGLEAATEEALVAVLETVATEETTEEGISDGTCARLQALTDVIWDLGFVHGLCGTWERTLYCLKHMARATFALKFTDIAWTRGPGSNGKDTLANRMAVFLGSYFANLACEALTACRDLDAPSQTIMGLRSRRFVCVREVAKEARIKGHIYRTIADPKGKVKARGLYGKDQAFVPHYLLFLCTNVPIDIDDKGGGTARRTRIIDMPYNFVDHPQAPNERQKDPDIENFFEAQNPCLFYLMLQVFRILLAAPMDHVTPIPLDVQEAGAEELAEPWMRKLEEFTAARLTPVDTVGQASTAADVRKAFFNACDNLLQEREIKLKLSLKGFHESTQAVKGTLQKTTKRVYSKVFPGSDRAAYVRLKIKGEA